MIDKIDNNQINNILDNTVTNQTDSTKKSSNNEADISLQVDYATLIEKAVQENVENTNTVEQAQQLLNSGSLDTSENIKAAAENIIKFGI